MRTNIVLDDDLVNEALELTHVRSKRELIHLALQELVQRRKAKDLLDLAGKIQWTEDYDYKRARGLGRDSASVPVPAIAAKAVPAKKPPLLERKASDRLHEIPAFTARGIS